MLRLLRAAWARRPKIILRKRDKISPMVNTTATEFHNLTPNSEKEMKTPSKKTINYSSSSQANNIGAESSSSSPVPSKIKGPSQKNQSSETTISSSPASSRTKDSPSSQESKDYSSIEEAREKGHYFEVKNGRGFNFSASEIQGVRDKQQDFMGMAQVQINDSEKFFNHQIQRMVNKNRPSSGGSTAAMYYLNCKNKTITTANLGDSRIYIVLRNKESRKCTTFLLTQDQIPILPRIKNDIDNDEGCYVDDHGVFRKKLEEQSYITMGGAIGDRSFPTLLKIPDIKTFPILGLVKIAGSSMEATLDGYDIIVIGACDGLTDNGRGDNYDYYVDFTTNNDGSNQQIGQLKVNDNENSLSRKIELFYSKNVDINGLANFLVQDAYQNEEGKIISGDNISVNACCIDGVELLNSSKGGVVGFVFDGHGSGGEIVAKSCVEKIKKGIEQELLRQYINQKSNDPIENNFLEDFNQLIKNQQSNPYPKNFYRGVGLAVEVVDIKGESVTDIDKKNEVYGLKIVEVADNSNKRFKKIVNSNGQPNWIDLEEDPQSQIITKFIPDTKTCNRRKVCDIFLEKSFEEAVEEISNYFHKEDTIIFETPSETYCCNNKNNQTALFIGEDGKWCSLYDAFNDNPDLVIDKVDRVLSELSPSTSVAIESCNSISPKNPSILRFLHKKPNRLKVWDIFNDLDQDY